MIAPMMGVDSPAASWSSHNEKHGAVLGCTVVAASQECSLDRGR
jgi:hypothetical protein